MSRDTTHGGVCFRARLFVELRIIVCSIIEILKYAVEIRDRYGGRRDCRRSEDAVGICESADWDDEWGYVGYPRGGIVIDLLQGMCFLARLCHLVRLFARRDDYQTQRIQAW